jgi:hypothetical protein
MRHLSLITHIIKKAGTPSHLFPPLPPTLLLILLPILLLSCSGGGEQSATPAGQQPVAEPAPSTRPALYLDGLYATSSAQGFEIARLFDSDEKTGWRTQDGAGPDEGIMLYFADRTPVEIAALQFQSMSDALQSQDASVQLYVNGRPDAVGKPGERIQLQGPEEGQALRSIFIRFVRTGQEQSNTREVEEALHLTLSRFPNSAFVGLQSLELLGPDGKPVSILPPERVPGQVNASSTLAPEAAYSPANLFDSRKEFVWVEGNKASAGIGEKLQFEFDQPVRISGLKIWNGYLRSEQHRTANARVKECSFGPEGGPYTKFTLRDTPGGQIIDVPASDGSSYQLEILSVYPGSRYKDLAISDLVFFDGEKPFVIESKLPARYQSALRTKTNNTPLSGILNRLISNQLVQPGAETRQSIILRSDGTFVLYLTDRYEGSDEAKTLADGNWELLSTANNTAQVKVFGKLYDMTNFEDYYKGREKKEATKIFSEVLTIDEETLSGTDYVRKFYLK